MSFIVMVKTMFETKLFPVTADCAVDALLEVADRLPLDAKVSVFPV